MHKMKIPQILTLIRDEGDQSEKRLPTVTFP